MIDWQDPSSNNTALSIGDLGELGQGILLPYPKSWYSSVPSGIEVWNALVSVPPGFCWWSPDGVAAVNYDLTFGENQTCPSSYKPLPDYKPPSNLLPNVTNCLTEIV